MIATLRMVSAILFMSIVVPVASLFVFPWTLITRDVRLLYATGMAIIRGMVWLTGTRVKAEGLDKIDPKGTYIFMSNHVSNLDPIILMPLIPRRTSVLVKKELWRLPVAARAFDLASLVPVERQNRDAAIQSVRRATEVMSQGVNMMVYPEGTRSPDGRLLPFKKGPFFMAAETGFPIVPVTMVNTFEILPKGKFAAKKGTARLVFHPPIDPAKFPSRDDLAEAVANAIKSALPADRQ
ncbi:MAG TPA: lysophospholipid acyltransferase family protein [Candidatus Angelobacter sp.]